jgi:arabinose-5-phosphate isomerase
MDKVLLVMSDKNLGAVIVANTDGSVAGIITDGDLKRHMAPDLLQKSAADVMTAGPKSIEASALGVEAVNVMTKKPDAYLSSLIVMDGEKLVGMIRLQDCLQAGLA